MPVGEVDEAAVLIEMLKRMHQRALPPREERNCKENRR